jgi:hypothetical protein
MEERKLSWYMAFFLSEQLEWLWLTQFVEREMALFISINFQSTIKDYYVLPIFFYCFFLLLIKS